MCSTLPRGAATIADIAVHVLTRHLIVWGGANESGLDVHAAGFGGRMRYRPERWGPSTVLAVDDRQRAMVAASDEASLERLPHANLRISAPGGRVLTREQFLANMRSGEIAAEGFERTAEDVSISGNIAVVMGRETFTPAASSELGRTFGAKPLQRRYTNVYVWQQDRWLWLARHANVLPAARP